MGNLLNYKNNNIKKINESNGVGIILYPKDFERFEKLILDLLRR